MRGGDPLRSRRRRRDVIARIRGAGRRNREHQGEGERAERAHESILESEGRMESVRGFGVGVLGAYALLYPRADVVVIVPPGIFSRLTRMPA